MKNIINIFMTTALALSPMLVSAQNSARENEPVSFDGKQDSVVTVPYATVDRERFVGAASEVTGEQLMKSGRTSINTAMAGLTSGLMVTAGSSDVGGDNATWRVRGYSRGSNSDDGPLVVVDGVPGRTLNSITMEEVDKIVVLKDATAKALYGSKAANGVIMVTTKRGSGPTRYDINAEYGVKVASKLPEFLNAADYTRLYNQAQTNDGYTTFRFSEETIAAYANGTADSELYPDVDYYDEFLDTSTSYFRASAQVSGSTEKVGYYFNVGYMNEEGLEAVGDKTRYDRINVRSNIDFELNKVMSAFVNVAARWDITKSPGGVSTSDFYSALSTDRPTDYALTVLADGVEEFGYNIYNDNENLLGELTASGYSDTETTYAQSNLGLNFDLSSITQGLSAKAYMAYDYSATLQKGKELTYSSMDVSLSGDEKSYLRYGEDTITGDESELDDDITRYFSSRVIINYDRVFNDVHEVSATGLWSVDNIMPLKESETDDGVLMYYQNDRGMNFNTRVNYSYDRRYVIEGTVNVLGSNKFNAENRWGTFGTVGAGWNISNEAFMQSARNVNHLKLKASWGVMGYDNNFDYLVYENLYGGANYTFNTGAANDNKSWGKTVTVVGNPDFTYEKSREINIGLEASLFSNTFAFEVNYFNEYRYDIPSDGASIYPDYMGYYDLAPTFNVNEVKNQGVEFEAYYRNRIGDLAFELGTNMTYTKAFDEVYAENVSYTHLAQTGQISDAIWGLVVNENYPMYMSNAEATDSAVGSSYGTVTAGDLRYIDLCDDGTINTYDRTVIGNSTPRFNYAFSLNLEYKGFEFYALGNGLAGFDRNLINYLYFDPQGENKWSVMALQAVTADPSGYGFVDDGATLPRLSTNSTHSYQNSTFWLENGRYFKLRTVQLAYNLPSKVVNKIGAKGLRVYLTGDNLCESSVIKDIDPENLNAGITGSPMFRTFAIGVNLTY